MPSKKLKISGQHGAMMIGDYGVSDDAISDPYSYLSQLNFHSDIPYMRIIGSVSQPSVSFPAVVRNTHTWGEGGCC